MQCTFQVQFALLFNCANSAAMTDDEVCKVDPPKKTLSLCYLSLKIYHSSKTKKKRKDRKNVTKTVVCSKKIIEKNQSFWTLKRKHYCQKKLNFIHSLIWSQERLIATPAWKEKKESSLASMIENQKKNLHHPTSLPEEKQEKYNQNPTLLLYSQD